MALRVCLYTHYDINLQKKIQLSNNFFKSVIFMTRHVCIMNGAWFLKWMEGKKRLVRERGLEDGGGGGGDD